MPSLGLFRVYELISGQEVKNLKVTKNENREVCVNEDDKVK